MIAELRHFTRCWSAVWTVMAAGSLLAAAEPVQFVHKPTALADAKTAEVKIAFELSAPTDVEVAVLGADGKVVRVDMTWKAEETCAIK